MLLSLGNMYVQDDGIPGCLAPMPLIPRLPDVAIVEKSPAELQALRSSHPSTRSSNRVHDQLHERKRCLAELAQLFPPAGEQGPT